MALPLEVIGFRAMNQQERSRHRPSEPLPADPLGKRLCQIFTYLWQAIVKANDPDAPWETLTKYPLRPRKLWNLWQDAAQIVGVRFGVTTSYALIDLDVAGIYHPRQDSTALQCLRASLETIGICRTFLTQSSWSGGLHLWIPLPLEVPTFWLAAALKQCLEAQGFVLKQGWLEIFPNCKAYARQGEFTEYQGHRLPLQPTSGSLLLNDDLQPVPGGLAQFFDRWDYCAHGQMTEELCRAIAQAKSNFKSRPAHGNSLMVKSWRNDLELEIEEGWTDYGQTNHLLKTIACYGVVFERLKDKELSDYVKRIATSRPGYAQFCRHQHEIEMRCTVWAQAAGKYYWPLGTEGTRRGNIHQDGIVNKIASFNRQRSQDAQNRICAAVDQLETDGCLPLTITARENAIVAIAHCSKQTLRKHLELWHPDHYRVKQDSTKSEQLVCTPDSEPDSSRSSLGLPLESQSQKSIPDKEVHTSPYMKGLVPLIDEGSKFFHTFSQQGGLGRLSTGSEVEQETWTNQPDTSKQVEADAATPSTSATSIAPIGGVDNFIANSAATGETQVDETKVCQNADSSIVAIADQMTKSDDKKHHAEFRNNPQSIQRREAYRLKMQRWLESGDPILMTEAQRWFEGQSELL